MSKLQNYPVLHYETIKEMVHASAEKYGDAPLFSEKQNGEYVSVSFREYCDNADALGTELCARGLSGKKIIVTGENSIAWVTSYMAVIAGVGPVVPIDKELPPEEIANIAKVAEVGAILYSPKIASKIETVDPAIRKISFDELPALIEAGKAKIEAGDRTYLDAVIDPNALSSLIFTSGTTGVSKGVMLSQRNILFNLEEMCSMCYIDEKDTFLSVLPLHHAYECTCGFICQIYRGSRIVFSEGLRYITRNMQEVHPTIILCVPLLIETMYRKIWSTIRKQKMEKKVRFGIKMTDAIKPESLRMSAKRKLFAEIHKNFGGKLRLMISGGAAVDPEILTGLRALGIHAIQGYGLTECAPLAALNRDRYYNDLSAGMASPNSLLDIYDVQDDGTGEIRYKGDNVMLGYYNMPELTAEVIRDGWFYSGDLGYLDKEGFLHITGRKKNVIVTSNGKNIFPEELETYLGRTPCVAESVVVGIVNPKKKDYDVVAIIVPDTERMKELYGADYTEEDLDAELKKAVAEVNATVQSYKRIETFIIRREEFPKNTSRKIKRQGLDESILEEYRAKIGLTE